MGCSLVGQIMKIAARLVHLKQGELTWVLNGFSAYSAQTGHSCAIRVIRVFR